MYIFFGKYTEWMMIISAAKFILTYIQLSDNYLLHILQLHEELKNINSNCISAQILLVGGTL